MKFEERFRLLAKERIEELKRVKTRIKKGEKGTFMEKDITREAAIQFLNDTMYINYIVLGGSNESVSEMAEA